MITLYHAWECPYSARTRLALAEKGISYRSEAINLEDPPEKLVELNPKGLVPILVEDDGFVLSESFIINEYLDEVYEAGSSLMPEAPREKALVRVYHDLCDVELSEPVQILKHSRNPQRIAQARALVRDALEGPDGRFRLEPRGPYLLGAFGMADVGLAPWAISMAESETLSDVLSSRFLAWVHELQSRSTIMTDPYFMRTLRTGLRQAA